MSDLPTKIFTKENLLCRDRVGAMLFLLFTLGYGYQTSLITMFPGDEGSNRLTLELCLLF